MSQLEYLIALISIIVGLGLTDLARSFRHLVRPGQPVRWDWIPLAWAATVVMIIVQLWWNSFETLQADMFSDAVVFVPYLMAFLVLYLACSFALPSPESMHRAALPGRADEADTVLDLETFYFSASHRRGFFGSLIVLILLSQVLTLAFALFTDAPSVSVESALGGLANNLVAVALLGGLIATDRRWVHAVAAVLTFGALGYTLTAGLAPLG